jgi:hypothetical protein
VPMTSKAEKAVQEWRERGPEAEYDARRIRKCQEIISDLKMCNWTPSYRRGVTPELLDAIMTIHYIVNGGRNALATPTNPDDGEVL